MRRDEVADLLAFLAVADERSFTRAAARLGTSQSALSHIVQRVEARLGIRLLSRTTRSVAPTQAGERLIETLRPAFDDIAEKLDALGQLRDKPAGTIRITTGRHAAETILQPALARLVHDYPDIKIEVSINPALIDIVTERFDAGIRLGEQVAKDMIAARVGPDIRMAVVGSPSYFTEHPAPQSPHELTGHTCINIRLPSMGGLYSWEFGLNGRELNVRVDGQLMFDDLSMALWAAVEGLGLAIVMEDQVEPLIADGRLVRVLADWCPLFPGYHIYYPSRRQPAPAFALLIEALRYRDPSR